MKKNEQRLRNVGHHQKYYSQIMERAQTNEYAFENYKVKERNMMLLMRIKKTDLLTARRAYSPGIRPTSYLHKGTLMKSVYSNGR